MLLLPKSKLHSMHKLDKSVEDYNNLKYQQNGSVEDIFRTLNFDQVQLFLLNDTKVTPLVWEANKKNWVRLILNKDTFHWYSHQDGRIELWIKEVPENIKEEFGLNKNIPDDFAKRYIFSHENNHHVLFYMFNNQTKFPNFAKIYNNLKKIRQTTGKWLSQLWNMSIYNSQERQTAHEEDFVELLNRYCMNPQNFREYLNFLVNWNETILAKKNLFKIPQQLADWLYNSISECVAIFLKENGMIDKIKSD